MPLPHSARGPVNPFRPEPNGICDRCGFEYHLAALAPQKVWAGERLVDTGSLVCPPCYDVPQENGFRTHIIGPDPKPVRNPRPPAWNLQSAPNPIELILDDPSNDGLDGSRVLAPGLGMVDDEAVGVIVSGPGGLLEVDDLGNTTVDDQGNPVVIT